MMYTIHHNIKIIKIFCVFHKSKTIWELIEKCPQNIILNCVHDCAQMKNYWPVILCKQWWHVKFHVFRNLDSFDFVRFENGHIPKSLKSVLRNSLPGSFKHFKSIRWGYRHILSIHAIYKYFWWYSDILLTLGMCVRSFVIFQIRDEDIRTNNWSKNLQKKEKKWEEIENCNIFKFFF